ncbi:VOC family protein [Nocardiopsis alkaliphila]|uniref:VOC family protein n=1 Tax=Nocardiopsis alkaliphila TaxID=225762 RepID=UPI00034579D1|nr:VOC family protein [Nocardiopsis alkaliphila]
MSRSESSSIGKSDKDTEHSKEGGMSENGQARYPTGAPCWAELTTADPRRSAAFYGELLGWRYEETTPGPYLTAHIPGHEGDVAGLGTLTSTPPTTARWTTYMRVEEADAAAERVRSAGGAVLDEPTDTEGLARTALCADPTGAVFGLWEARGNGGAHLLGTPGAWNFSNLTTSDPEAAATFYGEVFGWRTQETELGEEDEESLWVCLPGYGRFLQELGGRTDRDLSDGVARVFAVPAETLADTVPQWSVDFAVTDVEAVLSRVAQLGGTVVTPLADRGGRRFGAFQDPEGTVMAVSEGDDTGQGAGEEPPT